MEWVYDLLEEDNLNPIETKAFDHIKSLLTLEELLDSCIYNRNTDFIFQLIQPSVDCNSISNEVEIEFCKQLESIYIAIQEQISEAIDLLQIKKEFKGYNLVGFFRTTAIIALSEEPVVGYPSFDELYGHLRYTVTDEEENEQPSVVDRNKKPIDTLFDNSVLQTFIPVISGKCTKFISLFNN